MSPTRSSTGCGRTISSASFSPKRLVVSEYGYDVFVELVATISRGCGSSGWVYGLGAVHQWLVACFPEQAQQEMWADPGAIAAGSYAPVGKAVAVDGGYRLSGLSASRAVATSRNGSCSAA